MYVSIDVLYATAGAIPVFDSAIKFADLKMPPKNFQTI